MKLALLIAALLVTSAFGQSFSSSSTTVPTTFKGNDAKLIAKGFFNSPLTKRKDEFETTAAFEKRRSDLASVTLGDGSNAASEMIFKVTDFKGVFEQTAASYDADAEILTFSLRATGFRDILNDGKFELPTVLLTPSDFEDLGTGMAETAYGTRVAVPRSRFTNYRLVINNDHKFPRYFLKDGAGLTPLRVRIKMTPEQARATKPNFGVLYIAKLAKPYLGLDFFTRKPTLADLSEIKSVTYHIYGDVSEIWVFNKVTGEIYKKIRADEPQPPAILQ